MPSQGCHCERSDQPRRAGNPQESRLGAGGALLTAVNLAVTYVLAKALRLPERQARAIMFDVGIYNSGLGAVLAGLNFGPLSVLPPLLNAVMNMIIGALAASVPHNRIPAPEAVNRVPHRGSEQESPSSRGCLPPRRRRRAYRKQRKSAVTELHRGHTKFHREKFLALRGGVRRSAAAYRAAHALFLPL